MGPFTRPARGKLDCSPAEKDKEPGIFVAAIPIDDAASGDLESARTSMVDGRAEVVKATMTWW